MIFKNSSTKSSKISSYTKLEKICYGNYGNVFKAKCNKSGEVYALKELNPTLCFDKDGFSILCLREITILKKLNHENIVKIKEVLVGDKISEIYIVMEYLRLDLKMILDKRKGLIPILYIKGIIKQILIGLDYLHSCKIIHRDIKPSNLLFTADGLLKLADFGLARKKSDTMSNLVVTLWYRAPEILLGATQYDYSIDIWSLGCIIGEIYTGKVLFPGEGEIDQIHKIFLKLGFPNKSDFSDIDVPLYPNLINKEEYKPDISFKNIELIENMLIYNPYLRITAKKAINDPIFNQIEDVKLIREIIKDLIKGTT